MNYRFIVILFILFSHEVKAQNSSYPDSLRHQINIAISEKEHEKVFAQMLLLGEFFSNEKQLDSALNIYEIKLNYAIKFDQKEETIYSYIHVGNALNNLGKYDASIEAFNKGINIGKTYNLNKGLQLAYISKGDVEMENEHLTKALSSYFEAIPIVEERKDYKIYARLYIDIGNVEVRLSALDKAKSAFLKAVKIAEDHDLEYLKVLTYNNMGVFYKLQNNFSEAIIQFEKAIESSNKINDTLQSATMMVNLSLVYAEIGNFKKSDFYLEEGLAIYKKYGDKMGVLNVLTSALYNSSESSSPSRGLKYTKEAIDLAKEFNSNYHLQYIYEFSSIINDKIGKYKTALDYYKLMTQAKDSLIKDENTKIISELETKYELGLKESEILKLKYDQELQKIELDNQNANRAIDEAKERTQRAKERTQRYILYGGIGVLILVTIMLLIGFSQKKKDNRVISYQKKVAEKSMILLKEKNQEILDSINYARRIQTAILPPQKLIKEALPDSMIYYLPKDIVAGDFYWLEHQNDRVLFAVADCTGHGVPGAMVSVLCNNGLNRAVREFQLTDPGEILNKTREIIISEFDKSENNVQDGMDIALCALSGKTLKYAGANNPLWIIKANSQDVLEIKADKQPIGKHPNPKDYTTHTVELESGDAFYLFSDGLKDQFGNKTKENLRGKKFKSVNQKKMLLSIQDQSMLKQKEKIEKAFNQWKGDLEQLDDVCIMGVRVS